jgi:hypothetical protein
MPVPSTIDDLSTSAASNSPAGSDQRSQADNYLRAHASFIAQLNLRAPLSLRESTVGDGVADDTSGINTALAAGGLQFWPAGTYKITGELTGISNTQIIAEPGCVIDASSLGELDQVISFTGTIGSSLTLSANGTAGATTLSMNSVSGLAAGDPLYISANTLLPAGTASIYIGEWNTIKSISGTTITLVRPLDGTYNTADSAYVKKITPVENICIEGLKIIGSGRNGTDGVEGQIGIDVTYGRNVQIRGCHFNEVDYQAISLDWVDNAVVQGNYIRHDDEGSTNTTSVQYGIAFKGGCRSINITGNHVVGGKHGIVGTRNSNNGVHYDTVIHGNTIEGTWHAGITTHDNAKRLTVTGNNVVGCARGIEVRVQDMIVSDNVIDRVGSLGEAVYLTEFPSRVTVSGNRITNATYGVRMVDSGLETSSVPLDIVIDGNSMKGLSNNGITLEHTENTTDKTGWLVQNNEIQLPANAYGIYLSGTFYGAVIQNNKISTSDDSTANQGIYLLGGQGTVVKDNVLDKTAGIRLATEPTTSDVPDGVSIRNNVCTNLRSGFAAVAIVNGTNVNQFGNIGSPASTLTIASGAVTASEAYHTVDTESAAASDDLDTINGGASLRGQIVVFRAASSARTVVFKDGTGNLQLNGDFSLTHIDDAIALLFTGATWIEVARSDNTA